MKKFNKNNKEKNIKINQNKDKREKSRNNKNIKQISKNLKAKINKIEIKPQFLIIGLVAIITLISLIYFIFLKYSPIMNFKYEGYAISGKEITENLLGTFSSSTKKALQNSENRVSTSNEDKNIDLAKIEEQGTIFKKLNSYFIGNKEKTEIDLNYPIYINDKNTIYNLSQDITLISKEFEKVAGYPNISISDGKVYNGNSLERADSKEYIFLRTKEGIYINLKEIKVNTTVNEYIVPVNSLVVLEENAIRYYFVSNNILVFNEINDIDYNSQVVIKNIDTGAQNAQNSQNAQNTVNSSDTQGNKNIQKVDNTYKYEELLTRLGIIANAKNNVENSQEIEKIEKEDTSTNEAERNNQDKEENETNAEEEQQQELQPENSEPMNSENKYIKPEVTVEEFKAEVYTAKSVLHIKDQTGRIIEAPTFEIYKEGKIYLRRIYTNSGNMIITGLEPNVEYEIVGKYVYKNEEDKKIENTFYKGKIKTKGYEALGAITLGKEEGEIYNNKIQIKNLKITSNLNAEEMRGINKIVIIANGIKTTLKNDIVNMLLQGKEVTVETSEGLPSKSNINYEIKIYDSNEVELKVENNKGKTRTANKEPTARVSIKEQDIVSVTLSLKLTNKDNVKLENYKYIVKRANGQVVKEEKLSKIENKLYLNDLDSNQYYEIKVYADYDLNDNKGIQKNKEIGKLIFATKPLSTLGSLEIAVEAKNIGTTWADFKYKIDKDRTDERLVQILNKIQIEIVEKSASKDRESIKKLDEEIEQTSSNVNKKKTEEKEDKEAKRVVARKEITGEELKEVKNGKEVEIKYDMLNSNTTYEIQITSQVKQGTIPEKVSVTYNYKEFITLRSKAKVEMQNKFVTGEMVDFDVRIQDKDNTVLNNKVRMELRDEKSNLVDLIEIETNKKYVRKTYNKLEENKTYSLKFYADEYNEGSTDETYKVNYLIYELEIITEPGISGSIGIVELAKKPLGKNLVDMSSETKWYVSQTFNTNNPYGKEYDKELNKLILGCNSDSREILYNLREYKGQEVTISFKAKSYTGDPIEYVQNGKNSTNRIYIKGLTSREWRDFKYTVTLDGTGYLGFYIQKGPKIEIKNLQIELGNEETEYEEFNYILQSDYIISLKDERNEIATNDYYIKIYEDDKLVESNRYEEIPQSNEIKNVRKTYNINANKKYKIELVVKIRDRDYVLSELQYNTNDTEEIKGISSKEEFLELQPRAHYIVLNDIDLSGARYHFGGNFSFDGTIDFNGHTLTRDATSVDPIFYSIGKTGTIKNLEFAVKLNNAVAKQNMIGLTTYNHGTIENLIVKVTESTAVENIKIRLIGTQNSGKLDKFIINFEEPVYGQYGLTGGFYVNYGTISNGYIYGNNIKSIFRNNYNANDRFISPLVCENYSKVNNIYTLASVDTEGAGGGNSYVSNVIDVNYKDANVQNIYSVGYGDAFNFVNGPNLTVDKSINTKNNYYFADKIFNNTINRKTTELALYDKGFQNQILNSEEAFNVDECVAQGYYPTLKLPNCMPKQEYLKLPEVEEKDLPDILSVEVLEKTHTSAKVKFRVNNPGADTIQNITIKNLTCNILTQEYKDGVSNVIAEVNNPIICVSSYSVISITTKGAYNLSYTREFKEGERLVDVELYREIHTVNDWKTISKSLAENYILMQDIDFRNSGTDIVIYGTFEGKLDGNNKKIRNMSIKEYLIKNIRKAEIKNLTIENIVLNVDVGVVTRNIYVGIISNGENSVIHDINIKNVKIRMIDNVSPQVYVGGLLAYVSNVNVYNVGMDNINVDYEGTTPIRIGGFIGTMYSSRIENSFIQNINFKTKGFSATTVVGGLAGEGNGITIRNCYAEGNIKAKYKANIGGMFPNPGGTIENCYSYVNIENEIGQIGGIAVNTNNSVKNCLTLGDLYNKDEKILRTNDNNTLNYAYSKQRINGMITEDKLGAKALLNTEDLKKKETYTHTLLWGDKFNYDELEYEILPKVYKKDLTELLENQKDIYLKSSDELEIEEVSAEKTSNERINGIVIINNPKDLEITKIVIDDMEVEIAKNSNKNDKTYIEFNATPTCYYDNYKISKILYKENNEEREKDIGTRIDIQFYKEIYNYNDWQEIEADTFQNYKLMRDIDFKYQSDVKKNVKMMKLITDKDEMKTLKNVTIEVDGSRAGLISAMGGILQNVRFENITIIHKGRNYKSCGVISGAEEIENIEFSNITVNAPGVDFVGCIGGINGIAKQIKLNNVNIIGRTYVGGLTGDFEFESISDIYAENINVEGKGSMVGGLFGYISRPAKNVEAINVKVKGTSTVGGIGANLNNGTNIKIKNSEIIGSGDGVGGISASGGSYNTITVEGNTISGNTNVGGIAGQGHSSAYATIKNNKIYGKSRVGGIFGNLYEGNTSIRESYLEDCEIKGTSAYIGGLIGSSKGSSVSKNYVLNTTIEGDRCVGGIAGYLSKGNINNNYTNANINVIEDTAGGIVGILDNIGMDNINGKSRIKYNYVANGNVVGKNNIGGILGNSTVELYDATSYTNNYVDINIQTQDLKTTSVKMGGKIEENAKMVNTYIYKYSKINGNNINNENSPNIKEEDLLVRKDLENKDMYTEKLQWNEEDWDFSALQEGKYPKIKSTKFNEQQGIPLPNDEENMDSYNLLNYNEEFNGEFNNEVQENDINDNSKLEAFSENSDVELQYTFNYKGKIIKTYETYSEIIAEDNSKTVRNDMRLYVKDGNLYALPVTMDIDGNKIKLVENNFIIDSFNGKEYETVLGSDGKLYDLKEAIKYPENFVNNGIASMGNNLTSEDFGKKLYEIEVTYKNGNKVRFNYQTGEIISLTEKLNKTELFDYVKDKLLEIGNSNSGELQEITTKYEESKKLQNKLEKIPVEEALQRKSSNTNKPDDVANSENNEANNSLKETRYISIYNTEKDEYQIYQEEELLDTSKQEVISENEKIEANKLNEYYASEGKSNNTKMGIVWITLSIVGVVIILFVIKKRN